MALSLKPNRPPAIIIGDGGRRKSITLTTRKHGGLLNGGCLTQAILRS